MYYVSGGNKMYVLFGELCVSVCLFSYKKKRFGFLGYHQELNLFLIFDFIFFHIDMTYGILKLNNTITTEYVLFGIYKMI